MRADALTPSGERSSCERTTLKISPVDEMYSKPEKKTYQRILHFTFSLFVTSSLLFASWLRRGTSAGCDGEGLDHPRDTLCVTAVLP